MKKFGLFFFAAFAALGLASCNDSGSYDGPTIYNFVTVKGYLGDYWFETDARQTLYPGDKINMGTYMPETGTRAFIAFSLLDTPVEGFDYNIKMYGLAPAMSSQVEVIDTEEKLDALKDDAIEVQNFYLFSGDWINLIVRYATMSSDSKDHRFYLVVDQVSEPESVEEGYLALELRHDAGSDKSGVYTDRALSFNVSDIDGLLDGKKGVVIRYNNGSRKQTLKVDRISFAEQTL